MSRDPSDDPTLPTEPEPASPLGPTLPPAARPNTPPGEGLATGEPVLPDAPRRGDPGEEQPFDARAMVDATRFHVDTPSYGLPSATPESRAAASALRSKGRRKRRRNRLIGWFVALVLLAVVVVAGWLAYREYRDDQERRDREADAAVVEDRVDEAVIDDAGGVAPGALTPLGNQQQVIDAMDDVNSSDAGLSGGGLRDIVDRAQAAVDDANDAVDAAPEPALPSLLDVLPDVAVAAGQRLDDAAGFERLVVDTGDFAAASEPEYARWLALMRSQPQLSANSPVFDVLPAVRRGQVGIAVRRDGAGRLAEAVVAGIDPDLHVRIGG